MTRMTSAAAEASAIWSWMVASNSSSAGLRPAVSMSQNSAVALAPRSFAGVLFSLKSPLEICCERSAETPASRERFTASSVGGVASAALSLGDDAWRLYETLPTTLSRVVPASRATMAVRERVKRLNIELLPTLA